MIRSELIERVATAGGLSERIAEETVTAIYDTIEEALRRGNRVELRDFGAFSLKRRAPRVGRNPRNGASVEVAEKAAIHFRTGLNMRKRLNVPGTAQRSPTVD